MSPIELQTFAIDYTVFTRQLQSSTHAPLNLEIAAAAYDVDGNILNATVNEARSADAKTSDEKTGDAKQDADAGTANPAQGRPFRLRQEVDVPLAAASIRVAVRDANTDRIGAMEIKLPLTPENESANAGTGAPKGTKN